MAINLRYVCDELNQLPNIPIDMEFAPNFVKQEIVLRKKIKLPLVVASQAQIEDNIYRELAQCALAYVLGDSPGYDPQTAMQEIMEHIRGQTKRERFRGNDGALKGSTF